jgi:hypothetical protein
LIAEAEKRIGQWHSSKEVAAITFEEMRELTEKYETSILLEAMRRTGSCVQKECTLAHDKVVKAIYNLAERVKAQDKRSSKPKAYATVKPAQLPVYAPKVNPHVEELLTHWCEVIAADWMPLDSWMISLLKQYDYSTVRMAIDSLGRTYADTEAQAALDAVAWKCEQIVMVAL